MDMSKHKAQGFSDTETINAENVPTGKLTIVRADEVTISSGPRAGQIVPVIELSQDDKAYTYWPNKTSITTLCNKFGDDSDKWINNEIELDTENVMVRGQKRKAIFVAP